MTSRSITETTGYLSVARFGGDPDLLAAEYRRSAPVMNGVGRDHGLLVHAAARTDEGLVIVNLWPSSEGSEAAARDSRRLAVLRDLEIEPAGVSREHHDLLSLVRYG